MLSKGEGEVKHTVGNSRQFQEKGIVILSQNARPIFSNLNAILVAFHFMIKYPIFTNFLSKKLISRTVCKILSNSLVKFKKNFVRTNGNAMLK